FLQLLAARIGKELNVHRLSKDLGVSSATLKAWISALEASYILYLLPPYYENLGKRVIKSPKIYFLDTGLVCYLTNLRHAEEILAGPLGGPLFENFVVCELVKKYYFAGKKAPLYFWRSHDGLEVDIILDHGLRLEALECKLTQTITDRHVP